MKKIKSIRPLPIFITSSSYEIRKQMEIKRDLVDILKAEISKIMLD